MKSLSQVHGALAASHGRPLLLLFSGETCPWCRKLEEILEDKIFTNHCQSTGIPLQKITLAPKAEEAAEAQALGRQPTREIFAISSIPTLILFKSGIPVKKTEYLDSAESQGSQSYIDWLSGN